MSLRNSTVTYSQITQRLHWLSAGAILLMFPLGFAMARITNEAIKLTLYRLHIVLGVVILLMTLFRIGWRWTENGPEPPSGMSLLQKIAFKTVHFLLYAVLLLLSFSGIGLMVLGEMGSIFSGSTAALPTDLTDLTPHFVHGLAARSYIALLIAHIGGVILHQVTEEDVLVRMGAAINRRAAKRTS
ncbi:MAG: cytochrome b/b6 domain-containing protein [Ardenticatenaceae bacterium]|nr:cytochrome b/b6 domain-containing protein [Ardenticatenaceae bacterium]